MTASATFAELLREQLAPLGPIALRRMKTGVFCDDVMLGMVRDNTLYFRAGGKRCVRDRYEHSVRPRRMEVLTGPERRRKWSDDAKIVIVAEALADGVV